MREMRSIFRSHVRPLWQPMSLQLRVVLKVNALGVRFHQEWLPRQ